MAISALALQLSIFDTQSAARNALAANRAERLSSQCWRGGITNRATRTMSADPPRWVAAVEFASIEVLPSHAESSSGALLHWQLEQILPGDSIAPQDANGLILTTMNIPPEFEDEFNAWYSTEHIPLLSRIPGMKAARRFRAVHGETRYLSLYHVTDLNLYRSEQWQAANQTPWIRRVLPRFVGPRYFMFNEQLAVG